MCGGSEISFEAAFIFCCFCCCQNPGKIRIVTWCHPFYHHQYCHTSLIWLGKTIDLISTILSLLPLFPSSIPGTVCGYNNCVVPYGNNNVDSTKCDPFTVHWHFWNCSGLLCANPELIQWTESGIYWFWNIPLIESLTENWIKLHLVYSGIALKWLHSDLQWFSETNGKKLLILRNVDWQIKKYICFAAVVV